jgi:eukaryotic-like serine/threonine-protein kinase
VASETRLDDRYQLDDRIAAGGYGEVWRATDLVLGRRVAVKLLLAQHVQQAETLARFRAEAQRAGALNQQNIARVYDYVEPRPPQPPFLVMELIDGPSLAQVLADGPLPPAQVMDILAGAASGLQAAHDAGLVHRDIKPANLLIARDGTVKITDFGISYAADSAPMTASGMLVGTAGYMAPERLGAGPVTGSADLYALGIVGYEALAGSPPFTGTPLEIAVAHRDQPLPPLPASVPAGVVALIGALIAKDPAARPASAGDVARWAASQHDMLVGATRSDLAAPTGPAANAAAWNSQPRTQLAPQSPFTQPTPQGPRTPAGPFAGADPYAPQDPYGPQDPPRRRRKAPLIAALVAVLVIAAVAIGLVLSRSAGSGSPQQTVQSSTTPSVTGAPTATGTTGGGATQPAVAPTTPAQNPTTAPTQAPTTAPPTTVAPTTAPPTTAAPTATASAAAAASPTATTGDGQGGGAGTAGGGQADSNGTGH